MYEYKIFKADVSFGQGLQGLLEELAHNGWEPLQVEWDKMQIFARKSLILGD